MTPLSTILALLPAADWIAVACFFAGWFAYARFARLHARSEPSLLVAGDRVRREWMLETTRRENRIFDGVVIQSLSSSASFFASTTLLIIGGLLALLRTAEQATEWVRDIPFTARTSALVFDLKVGLLTAVFIYAFFRFTWSLRQYNFGALVVASAPEASRIADEAARQAFAARAGQVISLAAETFNDGLRSYYMSFAIVAWFFSPWALVAATAGVVWVLYRREFRSEVLTALDA